MQPAHSKPGPCSHEQKRARGTCHAWPPSPPHCADVYGASQKTITACVPASHLSPTLLHFCLLLQEAGWPAFYGICGLSVGLAWFSYPSLLRHFTDRFLRQNQRDTHNLNMLRYAQGLQDRMLSQHGRMREQQPPAHAFWTGTLHSPGRLLGYGSTAPTRQHDP